MDTGHDLLIRNSSFRRRTKAYDIVCATFQFPTRALRRFAEIHPAGFCECPDPRERILVSTIWAYMGLPPSQTSFISWASLFTGYVDEGAFFVRGGLHHSQRR